MVQKLHSLNLVSVEALQKIHSPGNPCWKWWIDLSSSWTWWMHSVFKSVENTLFALLLLYFKLSFSFFFFIFLIFKEIIVPHMWRKTILNTLPLEKLLIMFYEEKKQNCFYNCLNLWHAQSFFQCSLLVFPVLLRRNSVCYQELKKQVCGKSQLEKKSHGKSKQFKAKKYYN